MEHQILIYSAISNQEKYPSYGGHVQKSRTMYLLHKEEKDTMKKLTVDPINKTSFEK